MEKNSKILILGSKGLLGSAVRRILLKKGYENILSPGRNKLNLLNKKELDLFLEKEKPDYIFMVAGLVGGILGNKNHAADFLYENSIMILNLLESVKNKIPNSKILYTGSTCIYPRESPQPINENSLLTGKLEETNKGYALAKILGIVGCELYGDQYGLNAICAMPTNLYGPGDTYDLENGHMIPSLIKKFLMAKKKKEKKVFLWGTGNPLREALYSEDCADALIYLMKNYSSKNIVNIGTGFDYSIEEFAEAIKNELGWEGEIVWDKTKPEGVFEKKTDISRLKSIYPNFSPRNFKEGLKNILNNPDEVKKILG